MPLSDAGREQKHTCNSAGERVPWWRMFDFAVRAGKLIAHLHDETKLLDACLPAISRQLEHRYRVSHNPHYAWIAVSRWPDGRAYPSWLRQFLKDHAQEQIGRKRQVRQGWNPERSLRSDAAKIETVLRYVLYRRSGMNEDKAVTKAAGCEIRNARRALKDGLTLLGIETSDILVNREAIAAQARIRLEQALQKHITKISFVFMTEDHKLHAVHLDAEGGVTSIEVPP
jgi:hypothetical protein